MLSLLPHDLLLIVDPQVDFLPGGALAVPCGDEIIPLLNQYIKEAQQSNIPIVISRDWHPQNHISFKSQNGPWPEHCIQYTPGAAFSSELNIPENAIIVDKAFLVSTESYSALEGLIHETLQPITKKLNELNIQRIWIAGLALDYCVYHTAIMGKKLGFDVKVLISACRGIDVTTSEKAIKEMQALDIEFQEN